MSGNNNVVAARVAKFVIAKGVATFAGLVPHDDADKAKGVVYVPITKANLIADRAARGQGTRALDLAVGLTVPASLFDAKDIKASTFKTGGGVESLRESHRVEAKRGRTALKQLTAAAKSIGF